MGTRQTKTYKIQRYKTYLQVQDSGYIYFGDDKDANLYADGTGILMDGRFNFGTSASPVALGTTANDRIANFRAKYSVAGGGILGGVWQQLDMNLGVAGTAPTFAASTAYLKMATNNLSWDNSMSAMWVWLAQSGTGCTFDDDNASFSAEKDTTQALKVDLSTADDLTVDANYRLSGIMVRSSVGTKTNWAGGHVNAAIYVNKSSGKQDWTHGLYIRDITTGIDIGACTTGINVAANTVIPQLITIGTSANPMHWDGVASNILIYQENIDTTPASVTANKFVLSAAQSGATTSGRLECFRATVTSYSTNNVTASMRSVVGQTEFAGVCTYVGSDPQGCYGLIGAIHSGAALTATGDVHPLSLNFGVETDSALNGENSFIYMYNYGKVALNSLIQVYNGSTPSQNKYLLDLQNAVLGSYSGPCYSTGCSVAEGDAPYIAVLIGSVEYGIPLFTVTVP